MSSNDCDDKGNPNDHHHPPLANSNTTHYNLRGGSSPYCHITVDSASSSTLPHSGSTAAPRRALPLLPINRNFVSSQSLQQAQSRATSSSAGTTTNNITLLAEVAQAPGATLSGSSVNAVLFTPVQNF
jgi:hypothetical protein